MDRDYQILQFENQQIFKKWIQINHSKVQGIWLKIYKKNAKQQSINYDEALDVALCYGWIDGQRKKHD